MPPFLPLAIGVTPLAGWTHHGLSLHVSLKFRRVRTDATVENVLVALVERHAVNTIDSHVAVPEVVPLFESDNVEGVTGDFETIYLGKFHVQQGGGTATSRSKYA